VKSWTTRFRRLKKKDGLRVQLVSEAKWATPTRSWVSEVPATTKEEVKCTQDSEAETTTDMGTTTSETSSTPCRKDKEVMTTDMDLQVDTEVASKAPKDTSTRIEVQGDIDRLNVQNSLNLNQA